MNTSASAFKKTLCVLLSVLMIFVAGLVSASFAVSGRADDISAPDVSLSEEPSGEPAGDEQSSEPAGEEQSSEPASEEPSSEPSTEEPPTEPSDGAVAEIYHCASGMSLTYFFGHTWICIRNVSGETLSIGEKTIEPGQMIAAGLHYGRGLEYDREMGQFSGKSVSALKCRINRDQFAAAASEIQNANWNHYELFTHNCTNFSTSVWQAATGQRLSPFIFPFVVKSQMSSRSPVSLYVE